MYHFIVLMRIKFIITNHQHLVKSQLPQHQKEKKGNHWCMLLPVWNMLLLHIWGSLTLYVILKRALWELQGPQSLLPPFHGEHLEWLQRNPVSPKGEPLGSHMLGWKYPVHQDTPTMIGWTIGGRCTRKQVLRRSPTQYYPILRRLDLEVSATLFHSTHTICNSHPHVEVFKTRLL